MDNNQNMTPNAEVAAETEVKTEAPAATQPAAAPQQRQYRQPQKRRKKVCVFCQDKINYIDYKDTARLRKFTSERAKLLPRRVTGTCAKHQRQLTLAIKRSRQMALMPYIAD